MRLIICILGYPTIVWHSPRSRIRFRGPNHREPWRDRPRRVLGLGQIFRRASRRSKIFRRYMPPRRGSPIIRGHSWQLPLPQVCQPDLSRAKRRAMAIARRANLGRRHRFDRHLRRREFRAYRFLVGSYRSKPSAIWPICANRCGCDRARAIRVLESILCAF